jgi:hypothetical protein
MTGGALPRGDRRQDFSLGNVTNLAGRFTNTCSVLFSQAEPPSYV